jgi:hypothetical protein
LISAQLGATPAASETPAPSTEQPTAMETEGATPPADPQMDAEDGTKHFSYSRNLLKFIILNIFTDSYCEVEHFGFLLI